MPIKYEYSITQLAYEDIDNALDYIKEDLCNPDAANSLLEKIKKEIAYITSFPFARANCAYYHIDDDNIRHSIIGSYVLVYQVKKEENSIIILRFLQSLQNISEKDLI